MSNDEHDERAARIADYIRRVKLAIAGYERGDAVSTWVHREHLVEGIELAAEFRADAARHKAEVIEERDQLRARLEQAERDNEFLVDAIDAALQDRKYYEQLATAAKIAGMETAKEACKVKCSNPVLQECHDSDARRIQALIDAEKAKP